MNSPENVRSLETTGAGRCERCSAPTNDIGNVRHPDGRRETVCCACWNRSVYERRAARKAELAALPRCEFCTRRATYTAGADVQLCGWHFKRARQNQARGVARMGNLAVLGLFAPTSDDAIRGWAGAK